jgi:hypothetical protein
MHFSPLRLAVAAGVTAAFRLATLYLRRLDAKETEGPASERRAIAASRRRAQGHLWLLAALIASLLAFVLLFGANHLPLAPTLLLVLAIAVADAFFLRKMASAYGDARRRRLPARG